MRLNDITIENLLSFGIEPQRISFNTGTTVLVGPNGGGKTNVLRAIKLVRNLIRPPVGDPGFPYSQRRNPLVEVPTHRHYPTHKSVVKLGILFDSDFERYIMSLVIAGSIAWSVLDNVVPTESKCDPAMVVERARELGREFVSALSDCEIMAQHDRQAQSEWAVEFRFTINGLRYSYAVTIPGRFPQISMGDIFLCDAIHQGNNSSKKLEELLVCESPADWSIDQMLPKENQRVNFNFSSAFHHDAGLESDLIREGLIDGSINNRSLTLRIALDRIMDQSFQSDVDDSGFGAPVIYEQTPLLGRSAPATTQATLTLTDLYRWKTGDLRDRNRFQQAQHIFEELRGTGERYDLRTSLVEHDGNVLLEPVVVSQDGKTEVQANFAGSGATEFIRLSRYLAATNESVIVLDEPAARLHPRAQASLLRLLEQSEAQKIVVSHSPELLPLGNIRRISLNTSGESRVVSRSLTTEHEDPKKLPTTGETETPSMTDCQETTSTSAERNATNKGERVLHPVAKQLRKDPILRSIPFAEAVIFVSGYTEAIVYPQWYESWYESKRTSGEEETKSTETRFREVAFVNFQGDNNFRNYLKVAVDLGIPWAMIADGKSYEPGDNDTPKVFGGIQTVTGVHPTIPCQMPMMGVSSSDYQWFQYWKEQLEQNGVFSFATCWKNKEKKTVPCPRDNCDWTRKESTRSCDSPEWHSPKSPHIESFEDFRDYEPEFNCLHNEDWWDSGQKLEQAYALIKAHPNCPKSVARMFCSLVRHLQA